MLNLKQELEIMMHLRRDGRETLTRISNATNLPISTIYDRVKNNKAGFIKRHVSLLNFAKLGYDCHVNIVLKVGKEDRERLREFLLCHHAVNTLYRINNGFDFSTECVFRNMKYAEDFIDQLQDKFKIKEARTYHIIDEICKEVFLSEPLHVDLVCGK
ncbi:Lrp/AsnC family transcriptional regulator [Candidatus Woesearchaeota archaeon]|nr:Lrp/AsnC family transcriptional regulator [Candidatus Woesearchaeota archaeon]